MRRLISLALPIAVAASANPALAQGESFGVWKNPSNSVHVEIETCGNARCGKVVWANEKAKADAAKGGTSELIGTRILRDFKEQKDGRWKGKAFVPDLNKQFTGYATVVDPETISVKGCLVGRIMCKSQVWTRVR